jgi:hypothetical protein
MKVKFSEIVPGNDFLRLNEDQDARPLLLTRTYELRIFDGETFNSISGLGEYHLVPNDEIVEDDAWKGFLDKIPDYDDRKPAVRDFIYSRRKLSREDIAELDKQVRTLTGFDEEVFGKFKAHIMHEQYIQSLYGYAARFFMKKHNILLDEVAQFLKTASCMWKSGFDAGVEAQIQRTERMMGLMK